MDYLIEFEIIAFSDGFPIPDIGVSLLKLMLTELDHCGPLDSEDRRFFALHSFLGSWSRIRFYEEQAIFQECNYPKADFSHENRSLDNVDEDMSISTSSR